MILASPEAKPQPYWTDNRSWKILLGHGNSYTTFPCPQTQTQTQTTVLLRRPFFRLLFLIPLALMPAMLSACHSDLQAGVELANDLMYREEYVDAERLYRKLLKRIETPRHDLSEQELSQRLMLLDRLGKVNTLYLNNYAQAIDDYSRLVRHYPKSEQAFSARATVADIQQHKLGDLSAAIAEFEKLISEFPNRTETRWAQLQIIKAYFRQKNFEQVRTEGEVLLHKWPKTLEAQNARFQIANAYAIEGRFTEAIATYNKLLESHPDRMLAALVMFELGNSYEEIDESDLALQHFYDCLAEHPNPKLVQDKIRRVRKRLGAGSHARQIIRTAKSQARINRAISAAHAAARHSARSAARAKIKTNSAPIKSPLVSPAQVAHSNTTVTVIPKQQPAPTAPTPAPTPAPAPIVQQTDLEEKQTPTTQP